MTRNPSIRVGPRHAPLQLAVWLGVLVAVIAAALAGQSEPGDRGEAASLANATQRRPPATASPARGSPLPTPLPTADGQGYVGALRILAPAMHDPAPGSGALRVIAVGDTDVAGTVAAEVYEGERLVVSAHVPVVGAGEVRGWLRLDPERGARALRLRLLDADRRLLAEMPFVQAGADAIVLTAPFLPDRADVRERILVAGRVRNPVPELEIRIETLRGRLVARALTPVHEDRTRVPVQFVFWQSLPVDRDAAGERLRLTIGTPSDPTGSGSTMLVTEDPAVPGAGASTSPGRADSHADARLPCGRSALRACYTSSALIQPA